MKNLSLKMFPPAGFKQKNIGVIVFNSEDTVLLSKLIKPYIIASMSYKLPIC